MYVAAQNTIYSSYTSPFRGNNKLSQSFFRVNIPHFFSFLFVKNPSRQREYFVEFTDAQSHRRFDTNAGPSRGANNFTAGSLRPRTLQAPNERKHIRLVRDIRTRPHLITRFALTKNMLRYYEVWTWRFVGMFRNISSGLIYLHLLNET